MENAIHAEKGAAASGNGQDALNPAARVAEAFARIAPDDGGGKPRVLQLGHPHRDLAENREESANAMPSALRPTFGRMIVALFADQVADFFLQDPIQGFLTNLAHQLVQLFL